jgi:protein SCO1/2
MRLFSAFVLAGLISLLLGCTPAKPPAFQATDITGAAFGGEFSLRDHSGKPVKLSDYRGRVVALFFGFTHCPDVCPTTLGELAAVRKDLGSQADKLQVLFVTLDPERDTPEILSRYVPAFDASFIGLYGSDAETRKIAQQYKIIYQKNQQAGQVGYNVDHSSGIYLIDAKSQLRLYAGYGAGAKALSHDIKLLLKTADNG